MRQIEAQDRRNAVAALTAAREHPLTLLAFLAGLDPDEMRGVATTLAVWLIADLESSGLHVDGLLRGLGATAAEDIL